ncbi:MAG: galactose-1-phosphate uridylyltransferase [Desulfobacterota bacterium]|nr:galactose-1-phosphate uridylyltransferase [Thermodesulfobacteriota bacterium]MDW8001696.1 galactose-1-phosphate uridylyltransferase [Deltaproteobacteria bacterium]
MPELRKDPVSDRWVIISEERGKRPIFVLDETPYTRPTVCPLCPGNESMTPPEVFAIRRDGSPRDRPGWTLRVVPNKFPALRIEGDLQKEGVGIYDRMNGIGAHEVIIETPDHDEHLFDMEIPKLADIFIAFRERCEDLVKDIRFRYIMVFKNYGQRAGASIDHSHSQLIALPIVPKIVSEEMAGALTHFRLKERCIFCDIIAQEKDEKTRVVFENDRFLAISPYASRFPFEIWILPKNHESHFEKHAQSNSYLSLAEIFSVILKKYDKGLKRPPYNFIIHTSPLNTSYLPHYHWHIEIIPRLTRLAGFEWGTGFYINPTPPEEATSFLREV